MIEITESGGAVVAADTQASIAALDSAMVLQSRLCASIIETGMASHLAISVSQSALDALTQSMRGLVESREQLAQATRELAHIQAKSNLRETSYGCPFGLAPRGAKVEQIEA